MAKGFRELLKDNPKGEPLTLQAIKDCLIKIMKEYETKMFTPKHYVWEEDGQHFSCWEIQPGLYTGDLGYENYCKELVKQTKLYEQNTSFRSSKRTKHKSR